MGTRLNATTKNREIIDYGGSKSTASIHPQVNDIAKAIKTATNGIRELTLYERSTKAPVPASQGPSHLFGEKMDTRSMEVKNSSGRESGLWCESYFGDVFATGSYKLVWNKDTVWALFEEGPSKHIKDFVLSEDIDSNMDWLAAEVMNQIDSDCYFNTLV